MAWASEKRWSAETEVRKQSPETEVRKRSAETEVRKWEEKPPITV